MFYIWKQVSIYWELGVIPLTLMCQLHPHFLRYLLVYPFLVLSEWTGIPSNLFYTIFIYLCCIGSIYISYLTLKRFCLSGKYLLVSIGFLLSIYAVGLIHANGRGILASFGILIMFFVLIQWSYEKPIKNILLLAFAAMLCSVSTGVMTCFSASSIICLVSKNYFSKNKRNNHFLSIFFDSFVIVILLFLMIQSVDKNYEYYGSVTSMLDHGDPGLSVNKNFVTRMTSMLDHGYPGLLVDTNMKYLMALIVILSAVLFYVFCFKYTNDAAAVLSVFIVSSLFGRLTFLVSIPLMVIVFFIIVYKNREEGI